jgi:hypothetical protein
MRKPKRTRDPLDRIHRAHDEIDAALEQMAQMGYIRDSGRRKGEIVWKATEAGKAYFDARLKEMEEAMTPRPDDDLTDDAHGVAKFNFDIANYKAVLDSNKAFANEQRRARRRSRRS